MSRPCIPYGVHFAQAAMLPGTDAGRRDVATQNHATFLLRGEVPRKALHRLDPLLQGHLGVCLAL